MSLTSLAGHLAYALVTLSFIVRDIFWLRVVSVMSSVACITYNFYVIGEPLWLVINWNIVFASINVVQIVLMIREKSQVRFSDEERDLFGTLFQGFSPVEFMKLMRIAVWRSSEKGEALTTEGQPVASLMLIYSGEVEVIVQGKSVTRLRDGRFLGEMSFISGGNASASVKTTEPTRLVCWNKDELTALLRRNPSLRFLLQGVLSSDLSRKLARESQIVAQ